LFIEGKNFDEARIESMKVAAVHLNGHAAGDSGQSPLPWRPAHKLAAGQRKSPRQMRRATDADAFVRYNFQTPA
jgi:hypothetical protein